MAISAEKKKIITLVVLATILSAYCAYEFAYVPMQQDKNESVNRNLKQQLELAEANNESQQHDNNLTFISQAEASEVQGAPSTQQGNKQIPIEIQDADGNIVQAIKAPAPEIVENKRQFFLTDEDKRLVDIMRSNVLMQAQIDNDELKRKKQMMSTGVDSSLVQQGAQPANITRVNGTSDLSNFNDLETVKPTFLSAKVTDEEINDLFSKVEVASIADNEGVVTAYVRINGILTDAHVGKIIGDYEIKEVNSGYVSISYIPANVTRKIGHSGFSYSKQDDRG